MNKRIKHSSSNKIFSTLIILLIYCGLYIPYLTHTIQYDEAYTYFEYTSTPFRALFVYTTPNNHLLYSLSVWLSRLLLGDNLIALRLPAFCFTLLALAYIYRVGYRLKSHHTGLVAIIFLMTIPMVTVHIPSGRGYTLSILLTLMLFNDIFFQQYAYTNRWMRYKRIGLITLLIMTLPTMLLYIFPMIIWASIRHIRQQHKDMAVSDIMTAIVGTFVGTSFYTYGFIRGSVEQFSQQFGYENVRQLIEKFVQQTASGVMQPILLIIIGIGVYVALRRDRHFLTVFALILGTALVLAIAQEMLTGRVLFPRNYMYLMPFFALLAGIGVTYSMDSLPALRMGGWLLMALIIGLGWLNVQSLDEQKPVDLLQAAIETHAKDSDALIASCCVDYPLHYLNRDTDLFTLNDTKERFVFLPVDSSTPPRLGPDVQDAFVCEPEQWETIPVYVCYT